MGLSGGTAPEGCLELESGTHTVGADTLVRPGEAVLWLQHHMGHSELLGSDDLKINGSGSIPLSRRAWIKPKNQSRIKLTNTLGIFGTDELWTGLDQLHLLTLRRAARLRKEQLARDRRRLSARDRSQDQTLSDALQTLATTFSTSKNTIGAEPLRDRLHKNPDDALLDACRLVGQAADLDIAAPSSRPDGLANDLPSIARASRVRTRSVLLRGRWWRADGGPFLGRLRESEEPIALIPSSPSKYIAHNPAAGSSQLVTREVARSIDPRAELFYRPFPERRLA